MKNKLAVFTICQFEPVFLPVWALHYANQVAARDVYVLHHEIPAATRDRAVVAYGGREFTYNTWMGQIGDLCGGLGFNTVPVHNASSFSHEWLRDTVKRFQKFLLQSYEWVLFVEIDELVAPCTAGVAAKTLTAWLHEATDPNRALHYQVYRPNGFEIVHRSDEPPLDWDTKPLLSQRKWWYRSNLYSKPCLSSIPLSWDIGFHDAPEASQYGASLGLLLAHIHKIDFATALNRSREISGRKLSDVDVARRHGFQNYEADEGKMRWFFSKNIDTMIGPNNPNAVDAVLDPIPEYVKSFV